MDTHKLTNTFSSKSSITFQNGDACNADIPIKTNDMKQETTECGKDAESQHDQTKGGAVGMCTRTRQMRQDGGYAWLVLGCTSIIMFLNQFMWTSYGIFFIEFREHFPRNQGLFAWMYGSNVAVAGLTGLFAGPLVKLTNPRLVAVIGTTFVGLGYLIAAYSPNVWVLFLSYGLLLGIGNSFMNMASNVATQQYFHKRRTLANGILLTGTSLNMFVAPPLITFLVDQFGWRGAYLLLGGTVMNALPAALLLTPYKSNTAAPTSVRAHRRSSVLDVAKSVCACQLLSYIPFLFIEIGSLCFFLAYHTPMVFTVSRAVQHGMSRQQASIVMSTWALTTTTGQIFIGWVGDKIWRGPFMALSLVGSGVVLLLSVFCNTFPLQLAYAAVFGLFLAGYFAMKIPTLVDILGIDHLAAAHGFNLLLAGAGGILGPTMSNMIAERSGSYVVSFAIAGVLIIVAGLFMLIAVLYEPCMKRFGRKTPEDRFTDTTYSQINPQKRMTSQIDDAYIAASIHSLNRQV